MAGFYHAGRRSSRTFGALVRLKRVTHSATHGYRRTWQLFRITIHMSEKGHILRHTAT